ncbi:MAG: stage V sporulation protein S [Anaerolineae bacterium]|nr:stage V sporulation protein S [Anaerolineae bacterium]
MMAKGTGGGVLRVGKNAKVSSIAEQVIAGISAQGAVVLETVGAGAVNQAVKGVALARRQLEPEGRSLAIVPEVVEVPLGHGSQTVVHLTVVELDVW